jgi:hypothetical protein
LSSLEVEQIWHRGRRAVAAALCALGDYTGAKPWCLDDEQSSSAAEDALVSELQKLKLSNPKGAIASVAVGVLVRVLVRVLVCLCCYCCLLLLLLFLWWLLWLLWLLLLLLLVRLSRSGCCWWWRWWW